MILCTSINVYFNLICINIFFHFIFNNLYNTTRISIRTKGGIIHLNKTDVAAFSEGIRGPGVGVEETTVRPTELQSEYQTRYHL